MSELKKTIEAFCGSRGIMIPSGFNRHSPSRYAVIRKDGERWKLAAKTWFNVSDVINYLDNYCEGVEHRILDFKEERELKRRGDNQLAGLGRLKDVA